MWKNLIMETFNSNNEHDDIVKPKVEIIEEDIKTIQSDIKLCVFEIGEIKNNLVLISETITKLVTADNLHGIGSRSNFEIFGKFVEESLENLSKHQAEAVVLEIVEILHKYKTKSDV